MDTCRGESIRTGFMLAQGGEFAFVLLSLAKELKVLPDELNRLLIIVVVLSMALTPLLAEVGESMANRATELEDGRAMNGHKTFSRLQCSHRLYAHKLPDFHILPLICPEGPQPWG